MYGSSELRYVNVFKEESKKTLSYKGTLLGFATAGDAEDMYPVGIVEHEDGTINAEWIGLLSFPKLPKEIK